MAASAAECLTSLTEREKRSLDEDGYLVLDAFMGDGLLGRLRDRVRSGFLK